MKNFKYLKTFEELSPSLVKRAALRADSKSISYEDDSNGSISDPLNYKKTRQQYNKFSSYVSPEIKSKLNDAGFGYNQSGGEHIITWTEGRVDEFIADASVLIVVKASKYDMIRGDLQMLSENVQRKLIRVIKWLQEQLNARSSNDMDY